jgi:ElaB protein
VQDQARGISSLACPLKAADKNSTRDGIMDREQLIAEIKKQLQEELKAYAQPLANKIPQEQKDQLQDIHSEVTKAIKENPWAAAGLAIAAGYLLGRLLHKRSND